MVTFEQQKPEGGKPEAVPGLSPSNGPQLLPVKAPINFDKIYMHLGPKA
jgi:hypothetical protein